MKHLPGTILRVDLSSGTIEKQPMSESLRLDFVGGRGINVKILFDEVGANVSPLSPENRLIFGAGLLSGTTAPCPARFNVTAKSPLTGILGDSNAGGNFGPALRRAGIDNIVFMGKADEPVYLWIDDGKMEIRPARHLWGKNIKEAEASIKEELGDKRVRVAAIGQAGENLVRIANIVHEERSASRTGVGAVMGSKNLKAIALRGDQTAAVADPAGVDRIASALRERSVTSVTDKYRKIGTVANLAVFNRLGTLPTRNFQQSTFEHADALSGETLTEDSVSRRHGCAECTIRCERLFTAVNGAEQRLEYETLFALGPLCGIQDPVVVLQAAQLCDLYGLDTISTGGTVAWAMECSERGLLPDAKRLRFGQADEFLAVIAAIGERRGLGALLAEGSRRAAIEVGHESAYWAMHVKGLELPGYEPRSVKSMALGLAVSPRGACHNRSGAYEADFSGTVDRFHADPRRGTLVSASEDFAAVLDSLIVCKFLRHCFDDFYREAAELLSTVTGWDCSGAELMRTGARIHTMKKLFNVREGWQPKDDWLPERLLSETLPTGVGAGIGLSPDELRQMLQSYYQARGWNEDGFVPEEKSTELCLPAVSG